MSYANVFELNACLDDSLNYCKSHPERRHCQDFSGLLAAAKANLDKGLKVSDERFSHWRMEDGDGRLAWKHLSKELAAVQNKLRRVNAIGYLDQKVMYWDPEMLVAAVNEMVDYLRERTDDLDFAADAADSMERQLERATSEKAESNQALKEYKRFSQVRSDAMVNTVDTIASFRRAVRRELGQHHADYQAIRWPQAVASDEAVL